MSKELLLIFTRNPELGKVKTRLAVTIGDNAALDVYRFLLSHTQEITRNLTVSKHVYYTESILENDIWDTAVYGKRLQQGNNLGESMKLALETGFAEGFKNIIIIGSDMYDLNSAEIEDAFQRLRNNDFVIGPAEDGGYYLLGMKQLKSELFSSKDWGKDTVLKSTLDDLKDEKINILAEKNDVDYFEDIQHIEAFQPFLKDIKQANSK